MLLAEAAQLADDGEPQPVTCRQATEAAGLAVNDPQLDVANTPQVAYMFRLCLRLPFSIPHSSAVENRLGNTPAGSYPWQDIANQDNGQ